MAQTGLGRSVGALKLILLVDRCLRTLERCRSRRENGSFLKTKDGFSKPLDAAFDGSKSLAYREHVTEHREEDVALWHRSNDWCIKAEAVCS